MIGDHGLRLGYLGWRSAVAAAHAADRDDVAGHLVQRELLQQVPSVGRQSAPVLAQYAAKLLGQHTGLHVGVELFDRAILARSLTLRRCPLTTWRARPTPACQQPQPPLSHSHSLSTVPYRIGCAPDDGAPEAKMTSSPRGGARRHRRGATTRILPAHPLRRCKKDVEILMLRHQVAVQRPPTPGQPRPGSTARGSAR